MTERIIQTALENLQRRTSLHAQWAKEGPRDGQLQLELGKKRVLFTVSVRQEIRPHQLEQIEADFLHDKDIIIISYRMYPRVKEALREKGIAYLEANGNIFYESADVYVHIEAAKPLNTNIGIKNRAFTKTGLKVLFYLLCHPAAVNRPHRDIARSAGVALGNIPLIMQGLTDMDFLMLLNKREYTWQNRRELLERWITEFATVLRPKLVRERFSMMNSWRDLPLEQEHTVWGGEPAADLLTNHLRPEKYILYSDESKINIIKKYNLKPDKEGNVLVLDKFWKFPFSHTAPPIIVYTDLVLEGGKRNLETAKIIYNEFIEPNL